MPDVDEYYRPPRAPAEGRSGTDEAAIRDAVERAQPAAIATRLAALLLDGVVGAAIGGGVGFLKVTALAAAGHAIPKPTLSPTLLLTLLGPMLYHAIAESVGGATIGKAVCGIQVRTEDMRKCSFGAALGRNAAVSIDLFFCGLVALSAMTKSPMHQRVGDKLAHTVVIKSHSVPPLASMNVANGIAFGLGAWVLEAVIREVLSLL